MLNIFLKLQFLIFIFSTDVFETIELINFDQSVIKN